ncbi:alpha/beta hydrolase [Candidatus Ferrigenium straubiae]|uniref:alpha/beta hydrolase n=1 Tax=Candidatus Ferrigenium straubiae TaxID=2919506 RepID=UPI003F4AD4B4
MSGRGGHKMAMNGIGGGEVRLEARHSPSGESACFIGERLSFGEYVQRTTAMLRRVHTRLGAADLEKAIAGNAPFELHPTGDACRGKDKTYRRGVLLTHGLTDSPYFMRYLAGFFQENGFRAMTLLLPGHGTQPGDLLDVTWREWSMAVAYGTDRLAEEVDEVYLAGLSAGGGLSVYQSLCDDRVCGLFLFSPALEITPRAAWANLHRLYSWLIPSAKWVGIRLDKSLYKYESLPKNAVAQVHALTKKLSSLLRKHKVGIPVFAAASRDDVTANTQATLDFMARAYHPSSKLVLYTTDIEKSPPGIPAEKLELVNSVVPEQRILSSAHTSIVLPPDDAYYGAEGVYSNSIHYYPGDMEKYNACNNRREEVWQGEITEANLKAGVLRRLMYNPNFAALKVSMKRFIDSLP